MSERPWPAAPARENEAFERPRASCTDGTARRSARIERPLIPPAGALVESTGARIARDDGEPGRRFTQNADDFSFTGLPPPPIRVGRGYETDTRHRDLANGSVLLNTIFVTIGLSVLLHGLTATPLTARYAGWFAAHPRDAAPAFESVSAPEQPPQGWSAGLRQKHRESDDDSPGTSSSAR